MASNSKNLAELLNGDITVTSTDIADGSVTAVKLASDSVTTAKIADGNITAAKLASGAAVPDQTGNTGKVLTTDGTTSSWDSNIGRLTIQGSGDSSYGAYDNALVVKGTNYSYLEIDGTNDQAGLIFNKNNSTGFGIGYSNAGRLKIKPIASIDQTGLSNWKDQNTSGIEVDTDGYHHIPANPTFRAKKSSVQTNVGAGVVPFQTIEVNTGSGYSNSTHRFTAPVAGTYLFGVTFYASIRSGGLRVIHAYWRVNGGNTLDATMAGGTGGDGGYAAHPTVTNTGLLVLSANDYVDFYVTSASYTGGFDFENGYFWGYKVS